MALQKQPVLINFAQGLDTKADPYQVPVGKFLDLQNSTFDKIGRLQKRNGFGSLAQLPDASTTSLTTFNGNLTAIGTSLAAYSQGAGAWVTKGKIQPLEMGVLPLIRSSTNQSQVDTATALNGLICTVFTDNIPVGLSNTLVFKYAIADSITGQNIVSPTIITSAGTVVNSPRVFILGHYFIIVFGADFAGTKHLQYISINSVIPTAITAAMDISTQYKNSATLSFDGYVANNNLYLAWAGSDGGGAIRMTYIDSTLLQHGTVVFAGKTATMMSVTADTTQSTAVIYASFWDSVSTNGYTLAVNQALTTILAPTQIITTTVINNITSVAQSQLLTAFWESNTNYSYDASIPTHYIHTVTVTQAGVVSPGTIIKRSVGIASKAFIIDTTEYLLASYQSSYQPSYFLIDSTGTIIAKLAYSNGGGYLTVGLPSANISGNSVSIGYLIKDLIQAVNKDTNVPSGTQINGIYSQTGINLAKFSIGSNSTISSEIANTLNLTGGYLISYDGYSLVENNFFVWPDNIEATTSAAGGFLADQQYFYQVTYEWADNQGNINRSAPSIPITITTAGGNTSSNTIFVPTLRLTYKTSNPVKIVIYRWSVNQQAYYQVTSLNIPLLNNLTVDSVSFIDTLSDASILGNNLLYTTGGVIENISPPSFSSITTSQNRLFGIDSEDPNILWYSKLFIENVPVEMSDLFTLFVPPNTGTQGSTGPMKCVFPMDDKTIIFKESAIVYINGTGPDNTGANNQFSEPTFITSTVGCSNQKSIVFTPNGLMFESDKGIWLLNRNLSTNYIGASVEAFTLNATVLSAISIPETNQIRFTMSSGVTLMYDYYVDQWGTFINIPALSSTLYQNLHTYVNKFGQVMQETQGVYLDGSSPVLQGFATSWIASAGLIGFQRAYWLHLLGTYISPHKLNIKIAYDYDSNLYQSYIVSPNNFSPNWGGDALWGSSGVWGGGTNIELEQVFFDRQKCTSFQLIVNEIFDASFGTAAGAGLTLSGLNLTIGIKKSYPTLPASQQFG